MDDTTDPKLTYAFNIASKLTGLRLSNFTQKGDGIVHWAFGGCTNDDVLLVSKVASEGAETVVENLTLDHIVNKSDVIIDCTDDPRMLCIVIPSKKVDVEKLDALSEHLKQSRKALGYDL